jgi:hypothetical protein
MVSRSLLALGALANAVSLAGANEDCGPSTVWVTTTTTCADGSATDAPTGSGGSSPSGTHTSVPVQHGEGYSASAPASVPTDAAGIVDHTFHSWASPVHFWPDYAGNNTSPNLFSRSLVKIISDKIGTTPHIRVGGTSG